MIKDAAGAGKTESISARAATGAPNTIQEVSLSRRSSSERPAAMKHHRMNWSVRRRLTLLILALAGAALGGCIFKPPGESWLGDNPAPRHEAFVKDLHLWIGHSFDHDCLRENVCPAEPLPSGLMRHSVSDFRPWLAGCTFWFDVDPQSRIVRDVGYSGGQRACQDRR